MIVQLMIMNIGLERRIILLRRLRQEMTGTGLRGYVMKVGKHGGKLTDIMICIANILGKRWGIPAAVASALWGFGLAPSAQC